MRIKRTIERLYENNFESESALPAWEGEEIKEFSLDGKLRTLMDREGRRHEYEYGADGGLFEEYIFGPNGIEESCACLYDASGRLTMELHWRGWHKNVTECDSIEHYWDENAWEERLRFRSTDSETEGTGVNTYDDNCRKVSSRLYTDDSFFYKRIRRDGQGHKTAEFCRDIYYGGGECFRDTYVVRYRPDGLPTEEVHRIEENLNGTPSSVNLSKSFEYDFNREGDWTRKTERMEDGRIMREVRRTIEYWDIDTES